MRTTTRASRLFLLMTLVTPLATFNDRDFFHKSKVIRTSSYDFDKSREKFVATFATFYDRDNL